MAPVSPAAPLAAGPGQGAPGAILRASLAVWAATARPGDRVLYLRGDLAEWRRLEQWQALHPAERAQLANAAEAEALAGAGTLRLEKPARNAGSFDHVAVRLG